MNQLNRKNTEPELEVSRKTVRLSDKDIELSQLSTEAKNKLLNVLMSRHKSNRTQLSIVMDDQSGSGVRHLEEVDELMMFVSGVLSQGNLDSANKDQLLILLQKSIERQDRLISNLIENGDEHAKPPAPVSQEVIAKAAAHSAPSVDGQSTREPVVETPAVNAEAATDKAPEDVAEVVVDAVTDVVAEITPEAANEPDAISQDQPQDDTSANETQAEISATDRDAVEESVVVETKVVVEEKTVVEEKDVFDDMLISDDMEITDDMLIHDDMELTNPVIIPMAEEAISSDGEAQSMLDVPLLGDVAEESETGDLYTGFEAFPKEVPLEELQELPKPAKSKQESVQPSPVKNEAVKREAVSNVEKKAEQAKQNQAVQRPAQKATAAKPVAPVQTTPKKAAQKQTEPQKTAAKQSTTKQTTSTPVAVKPVPSAPTQSTANPASSSQAVPTLNVSDPVVVNESAANKKLQLQDVKQQAEQKLAALKTQAAPVIAKAKQAISDAKQQAVDLAKKRSAQKDNTVVELTQPSEPQDQAEFQPFQDPYARFDDPKALFKPVIEDDEDDENDEVDYEQLFELSEYYKSHHRSGKISKDPTLIVEVVKQRHGEVIDVAHLFQGNKYIADVDGKNMVIAHNKSDKSKVAYFRGDKMQGELRQHGGGETRVRKFSDNQAMGKAKRLEIPADTDFKFTVGADEYVIRSLMKHESPAVEEQPVDRKPLWKSLATSTAFHFLLLAVIALIFTSGTKEKLPEEPEFVKVDVKDLQPKKEVVKPKPKPPEPKPKPKPPKPKPVEKAKPKPKPVTAPKKVTKPKPEPTPKPKAGGGDKGNIAKRDVKKTGLLAALGTKKGKTKGPKEALVQVSSLDAVTTSDNSTSKLSVAGLTGKVQGARMTLATGEVINTKGTTDILRSGGLDGEGTVGSLETGGTGQRQVAAKVSPALTKQVSVKKGGMSREQIKRVIDQHMDEVVYCYEMALSNNPGLSGKAVFEWSIKGNGRVGSVSIKDSTVRSDEIHSCIKSSIKSWQFPNPKGGQEVIVSYPFIFDMVGF